MKSIWKGVLSFGLVTIPVRLYSAIQEHAIGFTLLHAKCHEPIKYERWCDHCKKEVAWADVVKGLKQEDGSYFILSPEKLKELKPKTTHTIEINQFVAVEEIKPIYLEHHYYLAPEKEGEKAFFLFKKVLQESNKVAIGTFVMRDKQYVCAINPFEDALLLTTLNYSYEIRPIAQVPFLKNAPKAFSANELKLAKQLIDQQTAKKFNLAQFKDTFAQELAAAIKKGKKVQRAKPKKQTKVKSSKKTKANESPLLTALRSSIKSKNSPVAYARAANDDSRKTKQAKRK